jgi:hypothetical protein
MPSPPVQTIPNDANQLALDHAKSIIRFRHNEDVLLLPATLFNGIQINMLALHAA